MHTMNSSVVFRHENEEFVLQNDQIVLKKYHREFFGQQIVEFQTKTNHNYVKQFFSFLQTGKTPYLFDDQIHVYQLLKEWNCHDLILVSYRFLIQTQSKNVNISHQNKLFPVNFGCLYLQSSAFQEFYECNPHEVFQIHHDCSPKTLEVFLDLLHCRILQPEIGDVDEVLELGRLLGCSSLCALINESSPESILSLILRKQQEDSFDFSFFENAIIENLESFLLLSDFGHVCLPLLSRVFQKTESIFPISLLWSFVKSCVAFHGSNSSVFLSKIKFQPAKSFDEVCQFLSVFSENNTNDFFSLSSKYIEEFSERFEKGQNSICKMETFINDLKNNNAELLQQMKKEKEKDQKQIEELHQQMKKENESGSQQNSWSSCHSNIRPRGFR